MEAVIEGCRAPFKHMKALAAQEDNGIPDIAFRHIGSVNLHFTMVKVKGKTP